MEVDCDVGRTMGCSTFCCRLIVRLTPAERERGLPGVEREMNCLPKSSDGWCIHFDRKTSLCRIWEERPAICREYDCNQDTLLQVVLQEGFRSLTQLVTDDRECPRNARVRIPRRDDKA